MGRDQTGIDLDRRIATNRRNLARFERPEQLGLQVEWQFANLVEEERTTAGRPKNILPASGWPQ